MRTQKPFPTWSPREPTPLGVKLLSGLHIAGPKHPLPGRILPISLQTWPAPAATETTCAHISPAGTEGRAGWWMGGKCLLPSHVPRICFCFNTKPAEPTDTACGGWFLFSPGSEVLCSTGLGWQTWTVLGMC